MGLKLHIDDKLPMATNMILFIIIYIQYFENTTNNNSIGKLFKIQTKLITILNPDPEQYEYKSTNNSTIKSYKDDMDPYQTLIKYKNVNEEI